MKKSVIYEPLLSYIKFGIVENPTSVSNANQASGYLDLESLTLTLFKEDGRLFLTYGLNVIGVSIGKLPSPWAK